MNTPKHANTEIPKFPENGKILGPDTLVMLAIAPAFVSARCKGVRCPPIFSLSNLINVGWL